MSNVRRPSSFGKRDTRRLHVWVDVPVSNRALVARSGATLVTWTPWDDWLPFRPEWVWVYLLPYLVGPVAVGLLTRETFAWFVRRGLVVVGVSLLIFIALPTRTVRPDIADLDGGATGEMYRNMIAIDGPAANAAPSLHVSLTCLLAWALVRDYLRWWASRSLGSASFGCPRCSLDNITSSM